MTKYLYIIFTMFVYVAQGQIHEVGWSVGGSNAIADIGSTTYVNPNALAFGVQYRYNRSKRHSWRASYNYIPLEGDDVKSSMPLRKERGYTFSNRLHELSAGLEFNFFEFDLHNEWVAFSPYLYTGIAGIAHKESYFLDGKQVQLDESAYGVAFPVHFGAKVSLFKQLVLSAEMGVRYTLADNLDGNNPKMSSTTRQPFGNTNQNDWYVTTMLTITYTFGQNPCYCLPKY